MKKLLRTRATDRDADLIVVTDEGHETDISSMAEAYMVIAVLANKVRAFYAATAGTPAAQAAEIERLREQNAGLSELLRVLDEKRDAESDEAGNA